MTDQADRPEEILRLIESQQALAIRRFTPDPLLAFSSWGVAWLVGFGAFFLRHGLDGQAIVPIPLPVAIAVLMSSLMIAGGCMAYALHRSGGQIRGRSAQLGIVYGLSWAVGMICANMIAARFVSAIQDEALISLLFAATAMLVTGLLYIAGGALFDSWAFTGLGVWVSAVNLVGAMIGPGWHALLVAVLCGGGAIALGLWLRARR
ncbi:hypothetical protein [Nonomuraea longicatena]|uniref:Transporter n=1 Tax=Nonomuraea longicatena TaxID=83682 RepID=A0ABP4AVW7_9ACTN